MSVRLALGWAIVIALIGAAVLWFSRNFEEVTEREWVGLRGEALRNEFLAAGRLTARLGVQTKTARALGDLDELPSRGLMLLADNRQVLTADDFGRVLAFVRAGGHLIVEAEVPGREDPLLDRLGVAREEPAARRRGREGSDEGPGESARKREAPSRAGRPETSADAEPSATRRHSGGSCSTGERLADIALPHHPEPLIAHFASWRALKAGSARPDFQWQGRNGVQVLSLRHGEGRVTVLASLPFDNYHIDGHDHAELLWQLLRWERNEPHLLIFDSPQKLSLWRWLVDHALLALIATCVLLAAWVWRVAVRFGPIASDPEPARRRLVDHLAASGRFQWRHGDAAELIDPVRDAAWNQLARAVPGFRTLDPSDQARRIADLASLPAPEARKVVAPSVASPAEFVALIRLYRRVQEAASRRRTG